MNPLKRSEGETQMSSERKITPKQREDLISTLSGRFERTVPRRGKIEWANVQSALEGATSRKIWSLHEMERTGGEPNIVSYDKQRGEFVFFDCSAESPKGRRSLCYDGDALRSRKEHKPPGSAVDLAEAIGIELLTEEEYRKLQSLGEFDTKTSSWVQTPSTIRKLGGALFCDRRYDTVFVYHNGAESYYAARGFRGSLRL
jgi:hypothetical protein